MKANYRALSSLIASLILASTAIPVHAIETWEKLDKRLKTQVYELNVGLKLRTKEGLWAQLADLSPKGRFPVYSTSRDDKGYRVVGYGSSFPIKTSQHDKTYFLTGRHVVESGEQIVKECERFYAAMKLYAEQTGGTNADGKYKELLQTVNLCSKGKGLAGSERQQYESTVDAIWDTYETYLSKRADPGRTLFQKYSKQAAVDNQVSYFLHGTGPVSQPPLEARLYKAGRPDADPDVAILTTSGTTISGMDFDTIAPSEGQEIQVIGYPTASEQIDVDSSKYYSPTFSTGRISRVAPRLLQVDAPVTNGNSGGPVVSLRGKVLGMVAVRAITRGGTELPNFGGAVTIQSLQSFAPELFSKLSSR